MQYVTSAKSTVEPESRTREIPFRNKGESKTFSRKGKLAEFVLRRPVLKMTKGSSLNRKEIVKKGNLEHRKGREERERKRREGKEASMLWVNKIGFPLEFS